MNTRKNHTNASAGILLMECLVYMAVLAVVLELGYSVFFRGWENCLSLRRNADQVMRALTAGERWRAEVRASNRPLRLEDVDGVTVLHIPQKARTVDYRFADDTVWRRAGTGGQWTEVLAMVKASGMTPDTRAQVNAWRWELELTTREQGRRFRPLLTFEAVPNTPRQP
jgi:Tfp pilus assembly protein FimT